MLLDVRESSTLAWDTGGGEVQRLHAPQLDAQRLDALGLEALGNQRAAAGLSLKTCRLWVVRRSNGKFVLNPFHPKASVVVDCFEASYGMNNMAGDFMPGRGDGRKVLCVEYEKTVAHVAGPNAKDLWANQVAPRHFRTLNVLFEDGHCDTRVPEEIDPPRPRDPR